MDRFLYNGVGLGLGLCKDRVIYGSNKRTEHVTTLILSVDFVIGLYCKMMCTNCRHTVSCARINKPAFLYKNTQPNHKLTQATHLVRLIR